MGRRPEVTDPKDQRLCEPAIRRDGNVLVTLWHAALGKPTWSFPSTEVKKTTRVVLPALCDNIGLWQDSALMYLPTRGGHRWLHISTMLYT